MISKIIIENFKSVQSLEMEIGRFNAIIGENGSGKTNLLEAIAMAAAASQKKLDHEFLASRGIRVTEPKLMRSGFKMENTERAISVVVHFNSGKINVFTLLNENTNFSQWEEAFNSVYLKIIKLIIQKKSPINNGAELEFLSQSEQNLLKNFSPGIEREIEKLDTPLQDYLKTEVGLKLFSSILTPPFDFLIFCPENSALRNFYQEGQIQPLGIHGEGLFRLLTVFAEKGKPLQELKECLQFIDWFDDFEIKGSQFGERSLFIKDRFLDDELSYFSQRSANEGFLYLMFYFSLFISEDTPKFFAIDNIENALNPKLCRKLMPLLFKLAEKYDKQVIFTTHNPAILDGLDLKKDEQRLFVARRNKLGHTKMNRVPTKDNLGMKLSEAFMEGHLGGIPTHF